LGSRAFDDGVAGLDLRLGHLEPGGARHRTLFGAVVGDDRDRASLASSSAMRLPTAG
jgi:hypothetical protein